MIYLLIVNIALMISFGLYHLCFRKLTFFQWNRFYLISTVLLALLIPVGLFIDLSSYIQTNEVIPMINISEVIDMPMVMYVDKSLYLRDILVPMYLIGVLVSFVYLLYRLILVRQLFKNSFGHISFSFFNSVFLGDKVKSEKAIHKHEQVHVEQGHSYDVMLMEMVKIVNWFNPVVYFISKELKFQHECIADEMCSEDKVAYAELLVANAMRVDKSALVQEFSNHSFLKKRIMMLFKNKSSNKKKLLYLSTVPMLLVVAGSTVVFNTSRAQDVVSTVESQFLDVKLTDKMEEKVLDNTLESESEFSEMLVATELNDLLSQKDTLKWGGNELFEVVEVNPEPPGGMAAFRKWIGNNFQYPQAAIDNEVNGTIQVTFTVERDGSLSNVKTIRDLGYGTGEAAIALMKKAPKWSPGIQNGIKVRVAYNLPIRLHVAGDGPRVKLPAATPELGYTGLRKWLNTVYKLPRAITKNDVDPIVYATFDVNTDGTLGESIWGNSELGEQFFGELINKLKQSKWIPAVVNGEKQKSRGHLYIKFSPNGQIIENYERVEVSPEPKGGMAALQTYLQSKISYPESLDKNGSDVFIVGFVVGKDGGISLASGGGDIAKDDNVGQLIKAVKEDVIKQMIAYGKWAPAILDGQKVEVKYNLAVHFDKGKIAMAIRGAEFIKSSLAK